MWYVLPFETHAAQGSRELTLLQGDGDLEIDFTQESPTVTVTPKGAYPFFFTAEQIKFYLPTEGRRGAQTVNLKTLDRYLQRKYILQHGTDTERVALEAIMHYEAQQGLTQLKASLLALNIQRAFALYFGGQETTDQDVFDFSKRYLYYTQRNDGTLHLVFMPASFVPPTK